MIHIPSVFDVVAVLAVVMGIGVAIGAWLF